MTKSELIETLAQHKGLPYRRAEQVTNEIFDAMSEALVAGDRIEIRGFGSFVVKEYGLYAI